MTTGLTNKSPPWAEEVLDYWLGTVGPDRWWSAGKSLDNEITQRFEALWREQRQRDAGDFLGTPQIALAAILLFDQFPRNMFRHSAEAFATDPLARAIANGLVGRGWDREIDEEPRQFAYMPFMHSEDLADQDKSLMLFAPLGEDNIEYARKHRDLIARFGRFPHRNEALGRVTLPEEKEAVAEGSDW